MSTPAAVLAGAPGIGKTTLVQATAELARSRGFRVMSTVPGEAETELSFAALADLLDDVDDAELALLPRVQRDALGIAIARIAPAGNPPQPLAIATGLLSVVRLLSQAQPVLVSVYDAEWLDLASADALRYVVRRAPGDRVRLLVAARDGTESELKEVLSRTGATVIQLGPLGLAGTRQLLARRAGRALPAAELRRLSQMARGNPLVALELGRVWLQDGNIASIDGQSTETLAVDLFEERVRQLDAPCAEVLLALALSPSLSAKELEAISSPKSAADAATAGVVIAERGAVRAAHPLLAAAVVRLASDAQERALHLRLSDALTDELRAAHHLALATDGYDSARASRVGDAARTAMRRGAAHDAAELAGHALKLTQPGDPEIPERLLTFAEYLLGGGELVRLHAVLTERFGELRLDSERARGHLLLAQAAEDISDHGDQLEQALDAAGGDPSRLEAVALKTQLHAVVLVDQIASAERWAREGLQQAAAGSVAEQRLRLALGWARILRGLPAVDDAWGPGAELPELSIYDGSIERPATVRLLFRGELALARASLEAMLAVAEERGEALSRTVVNFQRVELALRAGEVADARLLLSGWEEWGVDDLNPGRDRLLAQLAAVTGDGALATSIATSTLPLVGSRGWDRLETWRALGLAALVENDPERAAGHLGAVWEHTQREQIDDPGAFPVAGDLVEALVDLDRIEAAEAVLETLAAQADAQCHPWGLATAKRCRALVELSAGYAEAAAGAISETAAQFGASALHFDQGRTLLSLGRIQRRHRKWGAARESLTQAAATFASLGCEGWAERAQSELARVGGRRPAPEGELTATEERVALLAAEGLSNKQIARELVVAVHTVEVHLSRAYAKLGVNSRGQLARALPATARDS